MIELDRVRKQFAGKRDVIALDDVSLSIARGEMVAIIGPSGSGKSTLLNLIGGLDRPTSGEVRIDGEALSGLSDDRLTEVRRDKIGFIFQFFNLLPSLSSEENVGLPDRSDHRPTELSGGEQQRVAIARAVANAPRVLLADEPTGNLDPKTAGLVFDALKELVRQSGLAALIATHNYALAAEMDRTVTIEDGAIVAAKAG